MMGIVVSSRNSSEKHLTSGMSCGILWIYLEYTSGICSEQSVAFALVVFHPSDTELVSMSTGTGGTTEVGSRRVVAVRLSDKAYDLIRHKIITLELPPLSAIDEQALMQELGLGRTPIREALQRLAAEDLVTVVPRRGTFVSDISLTDLQKVFEARMVLEGFCARLAAERATAGHFERMEALTRELAEVCEGDSRALMSIDEQFHDVLYSAADNEFLTDAMRRLHALSFRIWHLLLDRLGDVRGAMEQHVAITRALRRRDGVLAERLLQQHIADFQREIKSVI